MKSISKSKLSILVGGIVISIAYVFYMFNEQKSVVIPNSQPTESEYSEGPAEKKYDSENKNESTATAEKSKQPNQNGPAAIPPAPMSDQDPFSPQNSSGRDNEHFQKITQQTNIKIQAQMKQEEITSLKESIENDKALLKKIEDSGTGVEDYKFIEQNMKKRIQRLKSLSK